MFLNLLKLILLI